MSDASKRLDRLEQLTGMVDETRDAELRDARELAAARRQFAAGILALPDHHRNQVLVDDDDGPAEGSRWPLDKMEACWRRLRELEKTDVDPALTMRKSRCNSRLALKA